MSLTDLRHYIRVYDQSLDPSVCGKMIESFNALERFQKKNGRGVRAGFEESAWTELNVTRLADPAFLEQFHALIMTSLARYNEELGLTIGVPNSGKLADLVLKRYRPGQGEQFQLHFDSVYQKADRYLVFLWYLNEVEQGGETAFPQLDITVRPAAGRLLMFPPYWMYQHEGRAPQSGDKYILSTYLVFEPVAA
jgi:2-oxoglutarate-Fe(II)-dependent oxygenase superfamily protein